MMKSILTTAVLLSITAQISGQEFNLSELIKINNFKIDHFDTYVTNKGYRYYENKNTDFSNATSYVYSINGAKKSYITKIYRKNQPKENVSFQTRKNTTYLKIKAELKSLGFKFINNGTFEGDTYFEYKKGNVEISLTSSIQKNSFGDELTSYEISVTKTLH